MKSYLLVITGKVGRPTLHHPFETTSDYMAKEYAVKQSHFIASDSYWSFALFRSDDDQQALLHEWEVNLVAIAKMMKAESKKEDQK